MTTKQIVSVSLVGDVKMREVNKQVFGKKSTTDVISMPYQHQVKKDTELVGEIVVNTQVVRKNAKRFGVTYEQELARVVAHGVLHLQGFEDKTVKGKTAMKAIEDWVVKEL